MKSHPSLSLYSQRLQTRQSKANKYLPFTFEIPDTFGQIKVILGQQVFNIDEKIGGLRVIGYAVKDIATRMLDQETL